MNDPTTTDERRRAAEWLFRQLFCVNENGIWFAQIGPDKYATLPPEYWAKLNVAVKKPRLIGDQP